MWNAPPRHEKIFPVPASLADRLDITPMLDLAFVLLVIFIITTTPAVNDLNVKLPTAAAHPKEPPRKALI